MTTSASKRPLDGIRVLDLSRAVAAPFCAQVLADMGASVVKVEKPATGDDTRHLRPQARRADGAELPETGFNFMAVNRNKKSITLNLASERGQEIVRKLAATVDVLVENYKVGDLQRYGLDYESIRRVNPAIIYCSVTGYGQSGPYADRPGYDSVFQAQSGVMSVTGEPDGEPQRVGYVVADMNAGMMAASAILGALYWRDANGGSGQWIDIALLDCMIGALGGKVENYLLSGQAPRRTGVRSAGGVPAQAMPCANGQLQVSANDNAGFRRLCQAIGRSELASDERFATGPARIANEAELTRILNGLFLTRTVEQWIPVLEQFNIIHGRINDIAQALQDPQVVHRGLVIEVEHPQAGRVPILRNPIRYSETPLDSYTAPPALGADTDDVLSSLGLTPEELRELKASGVT